MSDMDDDDLLNYLIVIVPDRAVGDRHSHTKADQEGKDAPDGELTRTAVADDDDVACTPPDSSDSSPLHSPPPVPHETNQSRTSQPQASNASYEHGSTLNARLLAKHPSGDRHPNPSYQPR